MLQDGFDCGSVVNSMSVVVPMLGIHQVILRSGAGLGWLFFPLERCAKILRN